jgi:outer membrane lipoprotein-sorting protein
MKRFLIIALLALAAAGAAFAQDVNKILKDLDELGDFDNQDFSAVYTIVSQKPGEKDSVSSVQLFRRDKKEQFTMIVLLPEVNKGQGYLREEDNVWFYDPTSRKFSFSSIKENIQDSEARNSDLTLRGFAVDYESTGVKEGTIGSIPVWVIDLKAKTDDVSYERLVLHVAKSQTVLLKEEAYSVSGRLMRTTVYGKYVKLGGKQLPSQIIILDELNPGERSQLTMTQQSVSAIPDRVFTKAYLEQVSK